MKLLLLGLLLFPPIVSARDRAFGWCMQGGQKVLTGGVYSTAPFQRSYPGCIVTVYITGSGGTKATIYSDNSGTPLSNPFTSGSPTGNGYWFFYADNGRYDVQMSGASIPVPFTLGDYALFDSTGGTGVTSVFGRTGAVVAVSGDYTAAQVTNAVDTTQTYSNPGWITALAATKLTGTLAAAQFPALTGDVTTPGASLATTLAASGVSAGTYGDSTHVGQFQVDAKGRVTTASNIAIAGGGSGTVTVVGAGVLASTDCVSGGGLQTLQTPSANCSIDTSGDVTANSFISGDTAHSGGTLYNGLTSGGVMLAAADVAGTAIVYVLPSTNGTPGQVLTDNGVVTCPTLVAGSPIVCHQLLWVNGGGTGTVTSVTIAGTVNQLTASGTCTITSTGTCTLSIPSNPVLPGTTSGTFSGGLTGTVTGHSTLDLPLTGGTLTGDVLFSSASPKVNTIKDANGNPFVISTATASAVDGITVTNAAAANPATVKVGATGSDSNINLELDAKGTGKVNLGSTNATVDSSGNLVVAGCTGCGGGSGGPSVTSGTFASLPGTCTHTSTQSDLYLFTDSLYVQAACTATNTWTPFVDGKSWGLPSATFTTWGNQSTATLTETNGYSVVQVPTSHSGGLAYRYETITALASFNHTFLFRIPQLPPASGVNRLSPVALSDGSKCLIFTSYATGGGMALTITTYTDALCTAGGSNPTGDLNINSGTWLYLNVVQDSSNLTFSWGTDGNTYTQMYQASKTAFFSGGATRIGYGGYKDAAVAQIVQLVGFK